MARAAYVLLVAVVAAGFLMGKPAATEAHAHLTGSTPAAGEVVPASPAEIILEFTESTERDFTRAQIYDARANLILEAPLQPDPENDLKLSFAPPRLENGTYTVVWRNVSSVDGHPQNGSFSFHVGEPSQGDVVPIGGLATAGPPKALSVFSRWATFAAHVMITGIAACTLVVLAPALRRAEPPAALAVSLGRMLARLWWTALGAAVLAAGLALLMQAWRSAGGFSEGLDVISDLVSDSRFGRLWLARVVLLGLMAYGTLLLDRRLFGVERWARQGSLEWAALMVGALGLLATISLNSHAAASRGEWREIGTLADFLHLTGAGAWVGGLATLVLATTLFLRADRSGPFLRESVPRFSVLAILAVPAISLTGLLQWYVRVGNLDDTLHSGYGQSLIAKALLLLPMLALGAMNLLVLSPRLRAATHDSAMAAGRFLRRHVIAEAGFGALVLLAAAFLTDTSPPDSSAAETPGAIVQELAQDDLGVMLTVTPGVTGTNEIEVVLDDTEGPEEAVRNVFVRLRYLDDDFGQSEETVEARGERTFGVTAQMGVPGEWEVLVIVQREGVPDVRAVFEVTLP